MNFYRFPTCLKLHGFNKVGRLSFSTIAPAAVAQPTPVNPTQIASQNYVKFQKKYFEFVKAFDEKLLSIEKDQKIVNKPPQDRAYNHPLQSKYNPINFSPVKIAELFHDYIGPEQVSPHYENFLVARKFLIGTYVGLFVLIAAAGTTDLNWIAKSSCLPFLFWMQIMYFYLEGRKSVFKPLLVRFYRRVAMNEMFQMQAFYHETMEIRVRSILRMAKNQLEYNNLHKDYKDVKAELINTFLYNEQLNLQRHVTERSLAILKQAETFENINQSRQIQQIIDKATSQLDQNLVQNREEINKKMFQSALEGLAKGSMSFTNDPILPLVIKSIQENVAQIQGLSQEEQTKLISLSTEQIQSIRDSDKRAKKDYLESEPKIDASLKTYENVRKQLASWGQ